MMRPLTRLGRHASAPMRLLAALAVVVLVSAAPLAAQQIDTGRADFTRYVAVGDSLSAGFSSFGWISDVQVNSFPALIHLQATGTRNNFPQPLMGAPGIPAPLKLRSLSPLLLTPDAGLGTPLNLFLNRPYSNLAIPGATVSDTLRTVTDNGGLHDLVLRGAGTALQQALFQQPTFITLWIGNNDALAATIAGQVVEGTTLTRLADFERDYRAVASALASTGAGLVIANIPDVATIPFLRAIPPVVINPATNQPVLVNGQPVFLIGPNGPLRPTDSPTLFAANLLAQGIGIPQALGGTGQPLPDNVVISAEEAATISNRVRQFNNVIATVARELGASFVDANALLSNLQQNPVIYGGIEYGVDFLTGGIISYDGIHPAPFGYAFVANEFIRVINRDFGAKIPMVDLYPFVFGSGSAQLPVSAGQASQVTIPESAFDSLRWALDVPRPKPSKPGKKPKKPKGSKK